MRTLFPIEPAFPEGFSYSPDFLTQDEEMDLYNEIKIIELHNFNFHGFKANRKVASFGYNYSFDNGVLQKGKIFRQYLIFLSKKPARIFQ